MEFKADI